MQFMYKLYALLLTVLFFALQPNAQTPVFFTKRVNTGNDDAEQRVPTGAMDLTSSDLEIMTDAQTTS